MERRITTTTFHAKRVQLNHITKKTLNDLLFPNFMHSQNCIGDVPVQFRDQINMMTPHSLINKSRSRIQSSPPTTQGKTSQIKPTTQAMTMEIDDDSKKPLLFSGMYNPFHFISFHNY